MAKILRVPSAQHLSRNWDSDPHKVAKKLVTMYNNAPSFNYSPLNNAIVDLLVLKLPKKQIRAGLMRADPRENVVKNYLEVFDLLASGFEKKQPDYVLQVERQYYPISDKLSVPFQPPIFFGEGGAIKLPWFSFWKSDPLSAEKMELFVAIVRKILARDPDLEMADFDIYDFSAPKGESVRTLKVIPGRNVRCISDEEFRSKLQIFAEGYELAEQIISSNEPPIEKATGVELDGRQIGLFDQ